MDGESGTGISGIGQGRVLGDLTGAALYARIADYLPSERARAAASLLGGLASDDRDFGLEESLMDFTGKHSGMLATDGY